MVIMLTVHEYEDDNYGAAFGHANEMMSYFSLKNHGNYINSSMKKTKPPVDPVVHGWANIK